MQQTTDRSASPVFAASCSNTSSPNMSWDMPKKTTSYTASNTASETAYPARPNLSSSYTTLLETVTGDIKLKQMPSWWISAKHLTGALNRVLRVGHTRLTNQLQHSMAFLGAPSHGSTNSLLADIKEWSLTVKAATRYLSPQECPRGQSLAHASSCSI